MDKESKNLILMNNAFKNSPVIPEALAAQRRASKDRPQAQAAILRDAAQARGSSRDNGARMTAFILLQRSKVP